jgi:4-aminobutyrate aminotransferase
MTKPGHALAQDWLRRQSLVAAPCARSNSDLVVERADGAHLFTIDGRDILDFGTGYATTGLGHRHPAVNAAVLEQLGSLWHTSETALNMPSVRAAEALVRVLPRGLDQVFFCNSGSEAVDAALKLARKATGRSGILSFEGAFHGRTYGAVSVGAASARHRAGMGPFLPGVHTVPYPSTSLDRTVEAVSGVLAQRVSAREVAAIIVEPMLGEGGYVVPPSGFLPWLRRLCDDHGILLIVDEVQTGLGRSGRWFAFEHTASTPDIVCLAKALGNGLPIGAMVANRSILERWDTSSHGSTFGGNPVACAAAEAVIATLERDKLPDRAARLGAIAMRRLRAVQDHLAMIREVRGLGLMIGIELVNGDGVADAALADAVRRRALERGLLVLGCGVNGNVIRLLPPLTIPEAELDAGLAMLEASLRDVAATAAR